MRNPPQKAHLMNLVNLFLERDVGTGGSRRGLDARSVSVPGDLVVLLLVLLADLLTNGRLLVTDTEYVGTALGQLLEAGLDGGARREHRLLGELVQMLVALLDPARIQQPDTHVLLHFARRDPLTRDRRDEVLVRSRRP
jgi:hypothetical protein